MKFFLGLFLTYAFLYSVHMLQCFTCDSIFCENPYLTNCSSNQSCVTLQTDNTSPGLTQTMVQKSCQLNELCAYYNALDTTFTLSIGVGRVSMTFAVSCCNTDSCNDANIHAPNKIPNGLKCKSCSSSYDEICDFDLDCIGNQDRCFNDTDASSLPFGFVFGNNTLKGCISRNLCQSSKFSNVTCFKGNFSNKGVSWMSEINFSFLLLCLITVVSLLY